MSAIVPQWALNHTATDLVTVSVGVLTAASGDNVQAGAILACEAFGTTLAMSPEVCHKTYMLCSQSTEPAVITFLKATVGYRKGDTAWQLAQNHAGVRFLGLAACLTTLDHWSAAKSLHDMIRVTASDLRLVPTAEQLKHLILKLEDRLTKSGFTESVLGWSIWLRQFPRIAEDEGLSAMDEVGPSQEMLVHLVGSTRTVGRLGEDRKLFVTTPVAHAAWIIAFLKWCLGVPPSIVIQDEASGSRETQSPATVIITLEASSEQVVQISLLDEITSIAELIDHPPGSTKFRGMINVPLYGQKMLSDLFGASTGIFHRACVATLPYACNAISENLVITPASGMDRPTESHLQSLAAEGSTAHWGRVIPEKGAIASSLGLFLGLENSVELKELQAGTLISDLGVVQTAMKAARRSCRCSEYQKNSDIGCCLAYFLDKVSSCVEVVIALTLADCTDPEGIKVQYRGHFDKLRNYDRVFFWSVYHVLKTDKLSYCEPEDIKISLLKLIGHTDSRQQLYWEDWVASSSFGQTLYPELLESQVLRKQNIYRMICAPGVLAYNGQRFNLVTTEAKLLQKSPGCHPDEGSSTPNGKIDHIRNPRDNFSAGELTWQIGIGEASLSLSLTMFEFPMLPGRHPLSVLHTSVQSLFVDCPHDRMAELPLTERSIVLTNPQKPEAQDQHEGTIAIVLCDRNEKMRFFTLTSGRAGVVRGDACLQCCVEYCRLAGLKYIIC